MAPKHQVRIWMTGTLIQRHHDLSILSCWYHWPPTDWEWLTKKIDHRANPGREWGVNTCPSSECSCCLQKSREVPPTVRVEKVNSAEGCLMTHLIPQEKERHSSKLIPPFSSVCSEDGRVKFLSLLWTRAASSTLQCQKANISPGLYKMTLSFALCNE